MVSHIHTHTHVYHNIVKKMNMFGCAFVLVGLVAALVGVLRHKQKMLELPPPPRAGLNQCEQGHWRRGDLCYAAYIVYNDHSYQPSVACRTEEYMNKITDDDFRRADMATFFHTPKGNTCKDFRHREPGLCICVSHVNK